MEQARRLWFLKIKKNKISSRHEKSKNQDIIHMLLPSLFTMIACMVLLGGSTWAYFMATLPPIDHIIEAANYDIMVDVSYIEEGQNKNVDPMSGGNQTYSLETGKTYSVTLTAKGNASTGYGILLVKPEGQAEENKYYTNQISQGDHLTFLLVSSQSIYCSFVPSWGTYAGTPDVSNGDTFEITSSTQI